MKTIGKGIVVTDSTAYAKLNDASPPQEFEDYFPDEKLPDLAIFVALMLITFVPAISLTLPGLIGQ